MLKFGMIGGGLGSYIGKFHRWGAMLDDSAELVSGCPLVQTICSMPARGFPASVQAITKALSRRSLCRGLCAQPYGRRRLDRRIKQPHPSLTEVPLY